MISITYTCRLFAQPINYYLLRNLPNEPFYLYHRNVLIGGFEIVNGICNQVSGRVVSDKMIEEIGELINGTI